MPNILKSLFFQVVIALGLGIALGMAYPDVALQMKPLGDGFIKLIKMLVPVIVFCVVVHGIAAAGDLSKVGRVGVRALIYFEIITTIALVLGIALAYYFEPGVGMNIDPKTLDAKALSGFSQTAAQVAGGGVSEFLMKLIPSTVVGAFTTGDILQVLIVSIMFGCAVSLCGERAKPVADFIGRVSDIVFKMMNFVVRLAPLGVFGAIAFTVGKYGIGSLKQLGGLVALFYVAVALFVVVVLGTVMRLCGLSLFKLLRYLREELTIVLGTAAGDSVLPQTMRKLELLGIKPSTVGLVIPTGYSFNLDAFSIYLTLAAVFIAQATNTPLATSDLLAILGIALLTSKGLTAFRARPLSSLPRHSRPFRPFRPSDWCCCCQWTGSSESRAHWATMSETVLPRLPSPHGKATSIGKRRIAPSMARSLPSIWAQRPFPSVSMHPERSFRRPEPAHQRVRHRSDKAGGAGPNRR